MGRPNVLLFLTDGQRTDAVGCYGNPLVRTPNIDAFSSEGALFRRSFCCHSVCMPNRASLFTGRYPHTHGVWANGVPLSRSEITLPQVLAEHGYATGAAGKLHFEPQQAYPSHLAPIIGPQQTPYYGFGEVHLTENALGKEYLRFIDEQFPELGLRVTRRGTLPEEAHDLHWATSQAIDFIERQAAGDRPFFCVCSFHELCPPCNPPEGFAGTVNPADVPVPELRESDLAARPPFYRQCYEGYLSRGRHPDEAALRRAIATYYEQAAFLDRQFGRLADSLRRLGVWEDTIVVFTTDHGLSLNDHYQWRHGPFLFDQVINVPLIWRVPGMPQPGLVTDELVENVDFLPTVLALCGVEAPPGVQGRSIAPLLRAETGATGKDSVLLEERHAPDLLARGVDPSTVHQIGLRTADWKLIHYVGYPHGELYDLRNDPGEFENRWADPTHLSVRREMEGRLLERLGSAHDPLPVREYEW